MAKEMELVMEKKIESPIDTVEESISNSVSKIDVKNVKVWYGDFNAIKGIDMKVKPNSITAFIGPSGCGKSTFLRLFNRMNDYIEGHRMEGKIKINGKNIYKKKEVTSRTEAVSKYLQSTGTNENFMFNDNNDHRLSASKINMA